MTPKHHSDFYVLNCLHSFLTENKLESHEKICKNEDFCRNGMSSEMDGILQFNQNLKLDKMPKISMITMNL